jgi:prepilin-type N-terminal cleavage/methylation domain-containing protein
MEEDTDNLCEREVEIMKRKAFTLIELLIVVAIIAILAAIAVPNFLEAQVRSKVSRVKSDMRSCLTALESYMIDNNKYPPMADTYYDSFGSGFHARMPNYITTPIAYITSLPYDPFVQLDSTWSNATYPVDTRVGERFVYYNVEDLYADPAWGPTWMSNELEERAGRHLFYSYGPDREPFNLGAPTLTPYDSSNGTVSQGNIIRTQKYQDGVGPRSSGGW